MLAKIPLFEGLSPAMMRAVVEEGEFVEFAPQAVICRQGEYTAEFYVLLAGLVGVYKTSAASSEAQYLGSLPEHSWFGEMSCMSHAPRSATVIAEGDVVVLEVPRHTFMKCYADRRSPGFKEAVDAEYRGRALTNHLASVSLFRGLRNRVLRRVAEVAELQVVEKGDTIVAEGEPGDAFYLVRTGHAKVVKGVGARQEILAWLCENSFFGELALIYDRPRASTVVAVDRMDLVRIPAAPFLALLDEWPDVKETVLERVKRLLAEEFVSEEAALARARTMEIGTELEVIKAGDALVIDMSKCTHCNMCVEGCIEAHEDRIPRIGKRGIQYGDLLLTSSCYNCKVPDCMLACKYGAIRRDRNGQVRIDAEACTGCTLCEPACPYGTIHMQSLVDEAGAAAKASVGPIRSLLSRLPGLSGLGQKPAPPEPEPEEESEKKKTPLRLAVKCDLCAGRADMACIYNCPCGAIERIDPNVLLGDS